VNRGFVTVLVLALVLPSAPVTGQGTGLDGDEPSGCADVPNINESYEWEYELLDDGKRYERVEKADVRAKTPFGTRNVTTFTFQVENANGEQTERGTAKRMAASDPWTHGLMQRTSVIQAEGGPIRKVETFDPPLVIRGQGASLCPGDSWDFTTNHSVHARQQNGPSESASADEDWYVQVQDWTNVTVPAGSFDTLPIEATRHDGSKIEAYYAPRAEHHVKRIKSSPNEDGTLTTDSVQDLSWYILNQRPRAHFKMTPESPEVGDRIQLNASLSEDPDGEITSIEWSVDGRTYEGPIVEFNATDQGTMSINLFVTDDNNRTRVLAAQPYVAPAEGSAVTVSGPSTAPEGRIVTLEAETSFDPSLVQWKTGGEIVGRGEVYRFYMNQTVTFQVDAVTERGRTYSDNHTVTIGEAGTQGDDPWAGGSHGTPQSATNTVLRPLEGQIVETPVEIELVADSPAELQIGNETYWRGQATSGTTMMADLEPGRHTLRLDTGGEDFVVNVTVTPGSSVDGSGSDSETTSTDDSDDASPSSTPAPGPVAIVLASAAAILLARRE